MLTTRYPVSALFRFSWKSAKWCIFRCSFLNDIPASKEPLKCLVRSSRDSICWSSKYRGTTDNKNSLPKDPQFKDICLTWEHLFLRVFLIWAIPGLFFLYFSIHHKALYNFQLLESCCQSSGISASSSVIFLACRALTQQMGGSPGLLLLSLSRTNVFS